MHKACECFGEKMKNKMCFCHLNRDIFSNPSPKDFGEKSLPRHSQALRISVGVMTKNLALADFILPAQR